MNEPKTLSIGVKTELFSHISVSQSNSSKAVVIRLKENDAVFDGAL